MNLPQLIYVSRGFPTSKIIYYCTQLLSKINCSPNLLSVGEFCQMPKALIINVLNSYYIIGQEDNAVITTVTF